MTSFFLAPLVVTTTGPCQITESAPTPAGDFVCVHVGEGISVNLVNKLTQSEIYNV